MHPKCLLLCGVTALTLAAMPADARMYRHNNLHQSTPAEKAQTADLNRQQLAQIQGTASAGGNMGAPDTVGGTPNAEGTAVSTGATASQQNTLTTEPTSYQRPGSSGMSGNMSAVPSGSSTTTAGPGTGTAEDQNVGRPNGNGPTNLQGSPSGTMAPSPANNSSTPE